MPFFEILSNEEEQSDSKERMWSFMKNSKTKKVVFAGILYAIILVMQAVKNVSPFISGPVINTAMVIATLYLGVWCGVLFSIITPLTSILIAPASAMTLIVGTTKGFALPIIMVGNLIFVLLAYFLGKKGTKMLIVGLISGALLKWLFMWGSADFILKPIFAQALGEKLIGAVNKVFSVLQLYSGLLSIILIVPIIKALNKSKKD